MQIETEDAITYDGPQLFYAVEPSGDGYTIRCGNRYLDGDDARLDVLTLPTLELANAIADLLERETRAALNLCAMVALNETGSLPSLASAAAAVLTSQLNHVTIHDRFAEYARHLLPQMMQHWERAQTVGA
jgi:hypothetical protein